jgi:hypothetical protein
MKNKTKELYDRIKEASDIINKNSMKGSGNYLIVNTKIAEYFELEEKRKNRNIKINEILK